MSEPVASQRKATVEDVLAGAPAAAGQFAGATPLGVRTDTSCVAGTDNWKIHDSYRSTCDVRVRTAYAINIPSLDDLSGLDARLAEVGWRSVGGGWTPTNHRESADDWDEWTQRGYHLKDLGSIGYGGPGTARLSVSLQKSDTPVPTPEPARTAMPGGLYFGSTEGTNWEETWAKQRTHYPYVLMVRGGAEFSQPW